MSRFKNYASIGALALASVAFIHATRSAYSNSEVEKDANQLSIPFGDSYHIEIYPIVQISNNGQTHNFSRFRIAANDPTLTSYSYDFKAKKIEGYELSPEQLPDFLRDRNSLSSIHQKICGALKNYIPTDSRYLTNTSKNAIQKRHNDVVYLERNFCQ